MKTIHQLIKIAISSALLLFTANAPAASWTTTLRTSTGAGRTSEDAKVRQSSGVSFGALRRLAVGPLWELGAGAEIGNTISSISHDEGSARITANVNSRYLGGFAQASYLIPSGRPAPPKAYLRGGLAMLQSRASVDRSSSDAYSQFSWDGVSGGSDLLALGVQIPLMEHLHVALEGSRQRSLIQLGPNAVAGEVEEVRDGTTYRFTDSRNADGIGVPETLLLTTYSATLGIGLDL